MIEINAKRDIVKCVEEENKRNKGMSWVRGSMTVEMSFLMPIILFLIMECILTVFYYHDKNILSGAAYETAVVGSSKAREKDGIKAGELEALFYERAGKKCILFAKPQAKVHVGKDEIVVTATASRKYMRVSIEKRAAVTEPEKYIRNLRRTGNRKGE